MRDMGEGEHSNNPSKLTQNTPRAGKQTAANIEAKCKFAISIWEFRKQRGGRDSVNNSTEGFPKNGLVRLDQTGGVGKLDWIRQVL